MDNKKTPQIEQITINLSHELIEELKQEARERGEDNVSEYIKQLIGEARRLQDVRIMAIMNRIMTNPEKMKIFITDVLGKEWESIKWKMPERN